MIWDYEHGFMDDLSINVLIGKTLTAVEKIDDEELEFTVEGGEQYRMYHSQNCCEHVYIDDIVGDLSDLVGSPILVAEESTNTESPKTEVYGEVSYTDESSTWTFYKLATIKGWVDIKWYGSSNGYYSESVDFVRVPKGDDE